MRSNLRNFTVSYLAVTILFCGFFFAFKASSYAAATTPPIIGYQGRLEDPSGNLLGGSFGTSYNFRFSLWSSSTPPGGTQLWPASTPDTITLTVRNGLFDARIGDPDQGFSVLNYNFTTSSKIYLQVEVYNSSNSSWETLSPRQPIVSSAFAINANTVGGYSAGTSTNNLALLDSLGNLNIGGGLFSSASGTNALALTGTPLSSATSSLVQLGANAVQGGSANGTFLGANPLSFLGDFINLQTSSTSKFKVDNGGTVTIGAGQSYTGTGAVTVSSGGTGALSLNSASSTLQLSATQFGTTAPVVQIANGNIFAVGSTSTNPSGLPNGSIYYNNVANKLRCLENGAWTDCIAGAGGPAGSLQSAYSSSTDPEIVLNSTVGGISILDNLTPISGNLFEIQSNTRSITYLSVSSSSVTLATTTENGTLNIAGNGALQLGGFTRLDSLGQATLATSSITSLTLTNPLGVSSGGTGTSTTPTNGQIAIGNGSNYTIANITPSTGINIQNGPGSITITNTGVQSLSAGSGLSISSATGTPTITNIGVTSLSAGSNIFISNSTGTVTITAATPTATTTINGILGPIFTFATSGASGLSITTSSNVLTLAIATSSANANGFLSSADWVAFNGKGIVNQLAGVSTSTISLTGSGISVTTSTNGITLTNIGVTSFNGATGTVTFSAPATTTINNYQAASFTLQGTAGQITMTTSTNTSTFALATTTVAAGTYTYASTTVDAYGRITGISNGVAPLATTTGNWLGTWQTKNPSDFLVSSTVYLSTTTGNWIGTVQGKTLGTISTFNSTDYLTSSTAYVATTTGNWLGTLQGKNPTDFLSSSTIYISTTTGNWLGTFQNKNATDFLSSSTSYVASLVAGSNISVSSATGSVTVTNLAPHVTSTINGVTGNTFTFATSGASGLSIATSSNTLTFTIATSSATTNGFLSSADWLTFSGKQGVTTTINSVNGPSFIFLTDSNFKLASSSNQFTWNLATTTATAGTYTYASTTVDAYGRITGISNGVAPLATTTGNWLGTWQTKNPSDFLVSSTVYLSTTTGNWIGTVQGKTLGTISTFNSTDYLTSSTAYVATTTGNWLGTLQGKNPTDFLSSSTIYISTTTGNWLGTFQNKNATDFLSSSTSYVASLVAGSNISVSSATGSVTVTNLAPHVTSTINGVTGNTFTFATSGASGLSIATSSNTLTFTIATSSATTNGFLSSADWLTFSGKQGVTTTINSVNGPSFIFLTDSNFKLASSSNQFTWNLATTTATAGTYTYASTTVDAYGRITGISNGVAPLATTTGNWLGTWQTKNPSDFLVSSTAYVATTTGNWLGTLQGKNPSDFLSSSTAYIASLAGVSTSTISLTGSGISVTTSTNGITLTNIGVTSLQAAATSSLAFSNSTGTITIYNNGVTSTLAGSNITVSGNTGTVTVNVTTTPSFSTLSVTTSSSLANATFTNATGTGNLGVQGNTTLASTTISSLTVSGSSTLGNFTFSAATGTAAFVLTNGGTALQITAGSAAIQGFTFTSATGTGTFAAGTSTVNGNLNVASNGVLQIAGITRIDNLGQATLTTSSISVLTVNTSSSLANTTFLNATGTTISLTSAGTALQVASGGSTLQGMTFTTATGTTALFLTGGGTALSVTNSASIGNVAYTSGAITPATNFTVGSSTQNLTLQGATTTITSTGGVNNITLTPAGLVNVSTGNLNLASGALLANGTTRLDNLGQATLTTTTITSLTLTNALATSSGGIGIKVAPTNGQLLIGSSSGWAANTLTSGSNISITNGAGTITVADTLSTTTINNYQAASFTLQGTAGQITMTTSTNTSTFALATTTVAAGTYTYASTTVDAYGRITGISNGVAPLATTTGNWLGTWQTKNPSDFLSSSTVYLSTTTGNWIGTVQGKTLGTISTFNSTDYLTSSTAYVATTTGNWLGTLQGKNPTDFLSSSTIYISTTTGNWIGTVQGKTLGTISTFNSTDYLTSSTAYIGSLNGSTSSTQTFATSTNYGGFSINTLNGVHTFNFPGRINDINNLATTTGNLIVASGTTWVAKAIGTDNLCLQASSTQSGGIAWGPCATGGSGITSLNGSTSSTQTFATSGPALQISTANGVHTFTLATSSATVTGVLSSADWLTFSGKQGVTTTINSVNGPAFIFLTDSNFKLASSSNQFTWSLATTTVSAGTYTYASTTVDAYGRITGISNGVAPITSDVYWTGTSTNLVAATGRTSLGLGSIATFLSSDYLTSSTIYVATTTGNWLGTLQGKNASDFLSSSTSYQAPITAGSNIVITGVSVAVTSTPTFTTVNGVNPSNWLSSNSGNWAGTWQTKNPSDFLSSSTIYISTTTGNWIGTVQGKTLGTISTFNSTDYLTSSTAYIGSLNGSTSSTQTFATSTNYGGFSINTLNGVHTFNFPGRINDINNLATTTGNLIVASGTTWVAKAIGTDNLCLQASSTQSGGIAWGPCATGGSGITSLNGSTSSTQTFSGSGISISTANGVHTFTNIAPHVTSTINGVTGNTFTLATSGASGLIITTSSNTLTFTIATSSATSNGFLSSTDWNTFNNKGSVSTSSNITVGYLPYWTSATGSLAGTSTLFFVTSTGGLDMGTTTANSGYALFAVGSNSSSTGGTQINIQNTASTSYSEFVVTADTGSASTNYGGFGINNSGLTIGSENSLDTFIEATNGLDHEACVNGSTSTQCQQRFFVGGTASNNLVMTIATSSVTIFSSSTNGLVVQNPTTLNSALTINTVATSTNLIANDDFDAGTSTPWLAKGSATIGATTTYAFDDTNSMMVSTTATVGDGVKYNYNFLASTTYNLSFDAELDPSSSFFTTSTGNSYNTFTVGYNNGASDVNCILTPSPSVQPPLSNVWSRYQCNFTPGAINQYFYIKQTDNTPHKFYIDAVTLQSASSTVINSNFYGTPNYYDGTVNFGGSLLKAPQLSSCNSLVTDSNGTILCGSDVVNHIGMIEGSGHSNMGSVYVGTGGVSNVFNRYINRLGSMLHAQVINNGIVSARSEDGYKVAGQTDGGFGAVLQQIIPPRNLAFANGLSRPTAPYVGPNFLGVLNYGINELNQLNLPFASGTMNNTVGCSSYSSSTCRLEDFKEAMRTIIARYQASAVFEETSSTPTTASTSVSYATPGWQFIATSSFNSGLGYERLSGVATSSISICLPYDLNSTGGTVDLAIIAKSDSSGAIHTFSVDGATTTVMDTRSMLSTEGTSTPIMPVTISVVRRFNIPPGDATSTTGCLSGVSTQHKIVDTITGVSSTTAFDYYQIEATTPAPTLVLNVNRQPFYTGLNANPSINDADVNVMNQTLKEVVNEFPNSVMYVDEDALIAKNINNFSSDGLHTNDQGHAIIASALYNALVYAPFDVQNSTLGTAASGLSTAAFNISNTSPMVSNTTNINTLFNIDTVSSTITMPAQTVMGGNNTLYNGANSSNGPIYSFATYARPFNSSTTLTVCPLASVTSTCVFSAATTTVMWVGSTNNASSGTSIIAKGKIIAQTSDFGEFIRVVGNDGDYSAGDLLSVSPSGTNLFQKSQMPYDPDLSGVVTVSASFIAGGEGNGINVIALAGQVPVKVTSEGGPISIGDYITSASTPGYGMKADKAGRILGQAMSSYDGVAATSTVMVFVHPGFYQGSIADFASSSMDILNKFISMASSSASSSAISELLTDRVAAGLEIISPSVITKGLTVDYIAALNTAIALNSDVTFFGRPYFNSDTGGFAVISAGAQSVDVKFDQVYADPPVVNATISLENDASLLNAGAVFTNNVQYLITNKSGAGFTIILNKAAPVDIKFSWIALAVKNAKTFNSSSPSSSSTETSSSSDSTSASSSTDATSSSTTSTSTLDTAPPADDSTSSSSDSTSAPSVPDVTPPTDTTSPPDTVTPPSDTTSPADTTPPSDNPPATP